jgi:hypothetical protein
MSFVEGDLLTAILKGGGKLCWEWGSSWDTPGPDHESVVTLMRNLNAWRQGACKQYLLYGRMVKPWPITGDHDIPMQTPRNQQIHFRSVFTSRWTHGGKTAQFLVNYTPDAQEISVQVPEEVKGLRTVSEASDKKTTVAKTEKDGAMRVALPALSAVMLEE